MSGLTHCACVSQEETMNGCAHTNVILQYSVICAVHMNSFNRIYIS